MDSLPKITEKYLKSASSAQSFSKGTAYYYNRAVQNAERDNMCLRAEVEGSEYQPYRVQINFDEDEIAEAACTCPYDYGGFCKHQIAVLLKYIHEPESFTVLASIAESLANHSREELISIIERMIEREPDLRNILAMPIAGKTPRQNPINLDGYRREIQRHLNTFNEDALIRSIHSIIRNARDFAKANDNTNAITIYGCILEETISNEDFEYWGEWELLEPLEAVLAALEDCMKAIKENADLRRSILIYWTKASVWNLQSGGIGFADNVEDWIKSYAQAADIPFIRPILEKALDNDWTQEHIEEFLEYLDLIEGKDPEATYKRILEKGLYTLYFEKMLSLKRLDDALSVWKQLTPHERAAQIPLLASNGYSKEALQYAEEEVHQQNNRQLLVWLLTEYLQQKQDEKALELAKSLVQRKGENWLLSWLIQYYEGRENSEMVLHWNRSRFSKEASIENYSALKKAAKAVNQWEVVEKEILKKIQNNDVLMTKIHMLEKRWLAAWASLELAIKNKPTRNTGFGYPINESYGLDLDLAEAARQHTPEKSVGVYLKYARIHIGERQRNSYAEAAQYLRTVKDIYLKTLNEPETWHSLIEGLRNEFKQLPALQDEFRKAGLYK